MARRSRTRSRTKAFTPRKRRMKSLPDKPGTTIHFVSSDVALRSLSANASRLDSNVPPRVA
jgi:hypothetical protein